MEKLVKLADFGQVVTALQGDMNDVEFANSQNLTRQTIRNVKNGSHLASRIFVEHFGYELVCRLKTIQPSGKKPAAKRSKR